MYFPLGFSNFLNLNYNKHNPNKIIENNSTTKKIFTKNYQLINIQKNKRINKEEKKLVEINFFGDL